MSLWVSDENSIYVFDGSAWIRSIGESVDKLGINATADTTNRLSVKSDAILFDHDGDDSQVKINKNSATDTSSVLFQTSFSGRAEFGCLGSDDFSLKVSPDGSAFYTAWSIDKDSGDTEFQKMIGFGAPEQVTISGGAITVTQSYVEVDTEASAASDDLETINGGNPGDILILKTADDARSVVLIDRTSGAGDNLEISGDFTMDRVRDRVMLQKTDYGRWALLAESSN